MFETYTFENIMTSMMEEMPDNVDTQEGSLLWNACAKCAMRLEEAYEFLEETYDNILVDTQDIDHLIASGAECGCPIIEATAATFRMALDCACAIGDKFQNIDYDFVYTVIEEIDAKNHIYLVSCDDEGTDANSYLGDVEPVEWLDGFTSGALTDIVSAGTEQEDEEVYRTRRLNYYTSKPFAGNLAYYRMLIDAMSGVGGCKPSRAGTAGGYVGTVIINDSFGVPSAALISTIQTAVDPSSGDGKGIAPIGAKVTISGVTSLTVNIAAKITFENGVTYADIKTYIEAAIDNYFLELNKTWETAETPLVVRTSQIELRLLEVSGIVDIENITLNGAAANLALGENIIPVRGTFTCS